VRARVARGGHDIPVAKIRERYSKSLANLITLIGKASSIRLFDNSAGTADGVPSATLVFRMRGKKIGEPSLPRLLTHCPQWAKPVAAAAIRVRRDETAMKSARAGASLCIAVGCLLTLLLQKSFIVQSDEGTR
jgi:hypothetical protein